MPLLNFASILNFAEDLESQDRKFFTMAAANPACAAYRELFAELAADAARNIVTVQRIRSENVTEMILEPVQDFTRDSFCEACEGAAAMSAAEALETATRLEARADRYYSEAAEKMKALTEVARALKALGKNRKAHIARLMNVKR
jgi:ferredoxin-NADP reductase